LFLNIPMGLDKGEDPRPGRSAHPPVAVSSSRARATSSEWVCFRLEFVSRRDAVRLEIFLLSSTVFLIGITVASIAVKFTLPFDGGVFGAKWQPWYVVKAAFALFDVIISTGMACFFGHRNYQEHKLGSKWYVGRFLFPT
jgi:hypothetical protein